METNAQTDCARPWLVLHQLWLVVLLSAGTARGQIDPYPEAPYTPPAPTGTVDTNAVGDHLIGNMIIRDSQGKLLGSTRSSSG